MEKQDISKQTRFYRKIHKWLAVPMFLVMFVIGRMQLGTVFCVTNEAVVLLQHEDQVKELSCMILLFFKVICSEIKQH